MYHIVSHIQKTYMPQIFGFWFLVWAVIRVTTLLRIILSVSMSE